MGDIQHQSEICSAKFDTIEEKIGDLRKKVDDFSTIKEVLVELKLLTAQQIEANAQRDEMIQEHGIALAKAMEALKELDKKSDKHEIRLENLDKKLSENEDKGNIHLADIGKNILFMVIGAIVTAILSGIIK